MRFFGAFVTSIAVLTAIFWLLPLHRGLIPPAWFLPAHVLAELIAIVTSLLIFATGWITWRRSASFKSLLVACVFLGVGLLDVSHVMTYEGMGLFRHLDNADATVHFWLVARAVAAVGLLATILVPDRPVSPPHSFLLLFWILALVGLAQWLILSESGELIGVFAQSEGLTGGKVGVEISLALIHLLSAAILYRHMRESRPHYLPALWAALMIMALSSVLFSGASALTELEFAIGHGYKVLAYMLLFRALFVEAVDIPYRRVSESERRLSQLVAEQRLAAVAFDTQVAIMVTDANQRILRVNRAFTDITGYQPEDVVGETPRILSSGLQSRDFYAEMWAQLARTGRWEGEMWNRRKNGEAYPEHLVISAVTDDEGKVEYYVANFGDLTNAKKAEERIHTLAYYDPLTRLANRRMLCDHIRKAQSGRDGRSFHWALLFIDLDNFKSLNDAHGYTIGDQALRRAAERLVACTRDTDIVARPGGDEFAILVGGLKRGPDQAAKVAQEVAAKVVARLRAPFYLNGNSWSVAASVGIVLFQGDQEDPDELIGQAEIAMYEAKRAGGDSWRFFDREMQQEAQRRGRLEEDLREAAGRDQLRLYCQVKVDREGRIIGCEGLLRWQHPERGLVSPADFIPVAEQSGLIVPIGRWVIEEACSILQRWSTDPVRRHWSMAINISGRQLGHPGFVQEVKEILHQHQDAASPLSVDPALLEFEITESLLLEDMQTSERIVSELSRLGIAFAMDDFGTGYSSLSYLKMLPLQVVKVDQSFVRDMLVDRGDAAIIEMVIALAKTLELAVVAEGVETVAHHRALVELGCDYLQGYLYAPPVPLEQLPDQSAMDALWLGDPRNGDAPR